MTIVIAEFYPSFIIDFTIFTKIYSSFPLNIELTLTGDDDDGDGDGCWVYTQIFSRNIIVKSLRILFTLYVIF